MVFTIIVHFELKDEADAPAFGEKLVEYARSYKLDEGTVDWIVHQDAKEAKKFMLIERYENPEAISVHKSNPLFATFGPWVEPLLTAPYTLGFYNELPKL